MSNLSQFGGQRPTRSITNGFSSSGWAGVSSVSAIGGRALLSGALTANTLKTIFSATGGGVIHSLVVRSQDATSRTIRARLTLDGVVVFDSTSAAIATTNAGGLIVGGAIGANLSQSVAVFANTAVFEIASSLSETDTIQTFYILTGN